MRLRCLIILKNFVLHKNWQQRLQQLWQIQKRLWKGIQRKIVVGINEDFGAIFPLEDDEAAFSICTVNFHDKEYGTLLAVGTAKGLHFLPKQSLTAGFIRIYGFIDEGKSQELLHKTQVKGVPLALCQFQGRLLADDSVPRWLTASHHLDFDTMAGADKFGNVYFVRLPQDVSDEIEEDPTGGKIKVGTREVEWCSQQGEGNC